MAISERTKHDLGWRQLTEAWASRTATSQAAQTVAAFPFFAEMAAAQTQVALIGEVRTLGAKDAWLPLGGIADIEAVLARVKKAAALDPEQLIGVATTARSLGRLRKHLNTHAEVAPGLAAIAAELVDVPHLYHPILEAFGTDGRLVDHASEVLGGLRRAVVHVKTTIERRLKELIEDPRYASFLQDAYFTQRDDRYVLPVRSDGKGFVPGIVHGSSQSGQTFFVEPQEMVELNNKLTIAECDVADEERRIYAKFSGWIAEEADGLAAGTIAAERLDVLQAAAKLAEDLIAAPPEIVASPVVELLHARHPLLLLAQRRCVANDVTIAAGKTLIISGPNAGGKSVALKTTGLCALMVRAGLHVPAERGSKLGWFVDVRTEIGDSQNLEHNLSTFSGHLIHLHEALGQARSGVLFLIDEIAVGTDPEQGAALAQAVLEAWAEAGATAIVTTHYERLKLMATDDDRFINASVGFDFARLAPTFKLHLGVPGSSGALTLAKTLGLSRRVVERAEALLGGTRVRMEELLQNVSSQREKLEDERVALVRELAQLQRERATIRQDRQRIAERFEKQQRHVHGDAVAALKSARSELDDVRTTLRTKAAAASADDMVAAKRRVVAATATVAKHEPKTALPPGDPLTPAAVRVGMPVLIPKLGARGEVASLPQKGEVTVQLGGMQMVLKVGELLLDRHRAASAGHASSKATASPAANQSQRRPAAKSAPAIAAPPGERAFARTPDSTLDVRGMRGDEAVAQLEKFIDDSMLAERGVIFILHGVGTGALRTQIRRELAQAASVAKFRAGEAGEGGDGITVAWLAD
ncbi:MAG: Smr/MutS family protein [Myxococcales bacterium]|nr:Smr/MutS family protein [Myxococcales bacterium]